MAGDQPPPESEQIIFATAGYDHTIKLWQTHSAICQRTMQHGESQVNMLEITPNRNLLAAASYQYIRMYDLSSNTPTAIITYEGVPKNITSVGFNSTGSWMYSGGEDGKVRIWDVERSTNISHSYDVNAPVTSVKLHPNEVELIIGDQNGAIQSWDMRTNAALQYIPEGDSMILDVAINGTGTNLAAVNSKGNCYVWSLVGGVGSEPIVLQPLQVIKAHSRQALKCKYSPDSKLLVTTSADQTAKIFRSSDGTLMQELRHDAQRWVWDAAFSADSLYVFTGSSDNAARLWNVKTGKVEREYIGHQKAITSIAFRDVVISS